MNEIIKQEPSSADKARTPEMIGAEIRMYVDAGRRITLLCGIEIGRRLQEAKEMLNHGEWLPWLKRETEFSERSAQNYMKVFNEYGAAQQSIFGPETNAQTFADLPISKALALLSVPESEREEFAAEVGAEALSVRELEEKVRERTAELEKKAAAWEEKAGVYASTINDLQNDLEDTVEQRDKEERARAEAEEQLCRIKRELEEIENRPQAVGYEKDELAIAEAVQAERERLERERESAIAEAVSAAADAERIKAAEAEKQLREKIAALEKAAAEKEKEAAEARADAQRAKEAAEKVGEADKLREELSELQKKLRLAAPEVADFRAAFDRALDDMNKLVDALNRIEDAETRAKMGRAVAALMDKTKERVQE